MSIATTRPTAYGPETSGDRSLPFASRPHNRYWWFRDAGSDYVPPIFGLLDDDEWAVMDDWYRDTEARFSNPAECSVPPISVLMGLVTGSNIRRVVQLGHYAGFSTLLLGFMHRKMGVSRGLYSFDLDPVITEYTAGFVGRAGLGDQVHLAVGDSAAEGNVEAATAYLGGRPQLVFIDSSHQYQHTLCELDMWYQAVQPGGFVIMHDVSRFASNFDATSAGGVFRAVSEWLSGGWAPAIMINSDNHGLPVKDLVYTDGCGLGIIQKPLTADRGPR